MKKAKLLPAFSLFVITIILLLYVTTIGIKNFFRYNRFKSEYKTVLTNLKIEKQRYASMESELTKMKSNDYWEWEIRQRLQYVKPDEEIYKFIIKPRMDQIKQ